MIDQIIESMKILYSRLKHFFGGGQRNKAGVIALMILFVIVTVIMLELTGGSDKADSPKPRWQTLNELVYPDMQNENSMAESPEVKVHANPHYHEYLPVREVDQSSFFVNNLIREDDFEELPSLVIYEASLDEQNEERGSVPQKLDLPIAVKIHGQLINPIYNRNAEHIFYGIVTEPLTINGREIIPLHSKIISKDCQFIGSRVHFGSQWRVIEPNEEEHVIQAQLQERVRDPETGHFRFGDGRAGLTMYPIGRQPLPEAELGEFGEKVGDTIADFADGFAQRAIPLNLPTSIQGREGIEALQDVGANRGEDSSSQPGNYHVPAATRFYLWAY